ncbi:hypothetical protein [Burkholderia plantarii]|uniref:hypothetical protein n=1 Tax=Burkholderia plantarii TaxID=41899 RepID=UPI0018DE6105|nr:hypothetical protein [Burkholderia plantarii]
MPGYLSARPHATSTWPARIPLTPAGALSLDERESLVDPDGDGSLAITVESREQGLGRARTDRGAVDTHRLQSRKHLRGRAQIAESHHRQIVRHAQAAAGWTGQSFIDTHEPDSAWRRSNSTERTEKFSD